MDLAPPNVKFIKLITLEQFLRKKSTTIVSEDPLVSYHISYSLKNATTPKVIETVIEPTIGSSLSADPVIAHTLPHLLPNV